MGIGTLMLPLVRRSGATPFYNIDGYAAYDNNTHSEYVQIIRNGVVEFYSTQFFFPKEIQSGKYVDCISGEHIYQNILESIANSLKVMSPFNIEEPYLISVYFHNMKDIRFCMQDGTMRLVNYPSNPFPFVTLPTNNSDLKTALQPLFDILWQCAGCARCHL